ncbi:MAG: hypothetical protein NZ805_16375, partial [Armatimonadetes bacterium]|nr:hypothetical protein [Armatimonadota bacterium]
MRCSMVLTVALVFVALGKVFAQSIMPVVTVPRLENNPKIDGAIEESEWSNASILSSFKQLRTLFPADLETKVYLAYDDRNIYLAFR